MVDKNSAPAFSMGTSRTNIKHSSVPGPGAYNSLSSSAQNNISHKISNQKRFNQYATDVPGPGTYSSIIKDHIPTAGLVSKQKQQKIPLVPGPGSYDPDYQKVFKSQSGYKLGNANKLDDLTKRWKDLPGPGQYDNAKSTLAGLNTSTKIGNDKRSDLGGNKWTPGPGEYQQTMMNGTISREPKFSFGKDRRSLSLSQLGPGPAGYNIKDTISESVEKKKGFSLKFRTNTESNHESFKIPGPGAYQNKPISLVKKGNPSFSVGKSQKLKLDNQREFLSKPSPGSYNFNTSSFETKHGIKFDIQKRKGLETLSVVPGPGAYSLNQARQSRQYSIPRSSPKGFGEDNKIPGPGSYDPKTVYNSQYQKIGLNKDNRKPLYDEKMVPGPGQYDYQQKKTGGFTIGHEKRQQNKKKLSPGPGNYNIPSTISNLPKYADVHR